VGVLILRELASMWRAGRERDQALFGLEREAATGKAVRSLVMVLLLVTIGVGIYTIAQFVAPALPERERRMVEEAPIVAPPRRIRMAADTPLPPALTATPLPRIVTAVPSPEVTSSPLPESVLCRNPNVQIVSPASGAVLDGPVPVVVTVRFEASAGRSYRVELGAGDTPAQWTPLGDPRGDPVIETAVVDLDPRGLAPGVYTVRLLLAEADGTTSLDSACDVTVRVP
jgi:hypothetical protein